MNKTVSIAFVAVLIAATLTFAGSFGMVHAASYISGIITSNATWTEVNSPYNLTNNVLIETGVTVTVGSEATVNLNGHYIRVNGTLIIQPGATIDMSLTGTENLGSIQVNGVLQARGTIDKPIYFNGGTYHWGSIGVMDSLASIWFDAPSLGWSEQTGSGCIIENSVMNKTSVILDSSVNFDHNQLQHVRISAGGGSPVISQNTLSGINDLGGGGIDLEGGSPIIYNNTLSGASIGVSGGSSVIDSNRLSNGYVSVYRDAGKTIITNNVISIGSPRSSSSLSACISVFGLEFEQADDAMLVLVENNILTNGYYGIQLESSRENGKDKPVTIQHNTISNNDVGIGIRGDFAPIIAYNNIYGNTASIQLSLPATRDINATSNWWGTTETAEIDRLIHDFYDDFDLGKVNYTPFLTEPNPQAEPTTNPAPLPTSTPEPTLSSPTFSPTPTVTLPSASPTQNLTPPVTESTSPSQVPTQSTAASPQSREEGVPRLEFYAVVATLAAAIAVLAVALVMFIRKNHGMPTLN